jgi:phosphate transport system substrate-binding protein
MKKNEMPKVVSLILVLMLLLTGCASGNGGQATPTAALTATPAQGSAAPTDAGGEPAGANTALSGEIMITGSTSAEPLVTALADLFMEQHQGVSIAVQGNGSSAGIKAAADGSAQLGMSSRELKDEEKEKVTAQTLCMDGIAVIVNKENAVKNLTKDQIASIFKGEITNWKDLGGADEEILLISREAGSGTRSAFEEICGLTQKDEAGNEVSLVDESRALIADSTNAVSTTVSTKPAAIGYISLGSYDSSLVTALQVDGVDCTQENILAGTYAIARPFLLVSGPAAEEIAGAFLEFACSDEGQAVVTEHKYIPVK